MGSKKSSREMIRRSLSAFYPRLWRYCVVLTGDRPTADDLAQATSLRVLEKADQFEAGTHFDRWTIRIAQRTWINDLRKQKVRTGAGLVSAEDADLVSNTPDQEANIFASEVLSEIAALPDGQREAVALVYVEGFSYKEAAETLDVPIGTVMSRLAAARRKIAERTKDEVEP